MATQKVEVTTSAPITKSTVTQKMYPRGPVQDDKPSIISERVIEHEIIVPKRIVREEVIEKILIVPETVVREELVEEVQIVKETIVEISKPIFQEKIIEVPQVEYKDKLVEVVEKVYEKKIKEVPKITYQEKLVERTKYVDFDGNPIPPPEIEVRETVVEKVVEVPEIKEETIIKEVIVPTYVEKVITPEQSTSINIPVPVEAVTRYDYQLKHPTPVLNEIDYALYIPKFIEVPVYSELYTPQQLTGMQETQDQLQYLLQQPMALPHIEALATDVRQQNYLTSQATPEMFKANLTQAWRVGQLQMAAPATGMPANS